MTSSSWNHENIDINSHGIVTNDEEVNSLNEQDINERSILLLLSSVEDSNDGEFLL